MVLKRSITLNPCKIFQTNQKFYLHKFSDNNDVLKGRDYLKDSKAKKALLYITTAVKYFSPPSVEKRLKRIRMQNAFVRPYQRTNQLILLSIMN